MPGWLGGLSFASQNRHSEIPAGICCFHCTKLRGLYTELVTILLSSVVADHSLTASIHRQTVSDQCIPFRA